MAVAGTIALRPLLFRKTAVVLFWHSYAPGLLFSLESGLQLAIEEREGRAGGMNLSLRAPAHVWDGDTAGGTLFAVLGAFEHGDRYGYENLPALSVDLFASEERHDGVREPSALANDARVVESAVRWAKARGARRAALLASRFEGRSGRVASGFEEQARRASLPVVGRFDVGALTDSLAGEILDTKPDFVFHAGEEEPWKHAAELCTNLRNLGCRAPILVVDSSVWRLPPLSSGIPVHGVHVISPLPSPTPGFSARFFARWGKAADREAYTAYLTGRIVLDAIEREGRNGPAAVRAAAYGDPRFSSARVVPSIYRVEQGKLEFVGEAP